MAMHYQGFEVEVFEKVREFQRLGDSTSGIGLGMSVAKGFVDAMAGTIRTEDTPGGGLTVVVSLPVAGGDS